MGTKDGLLGNVSIRPDTEDEDDGNGGVGARILEWNAIVGTVEKGGGIRRLRLGFCRVVVVGFGAELPIESAARLVRRGVARGTALISLSG